MMRDLLINFLDAEDSLIKSINGELDWPRNNRRIAAKIATLSDSQARRDLHSMVIALNCVATNVDGGQEMTPEEGMKAARTLLHDLGYPLVDEVDDE